MGKALSGPRVFRKTAADVLAKAEEYIKTVSNDYTITLRVNGDECGLDTFLEQATPNARVDLEVVNDNNEADKKLELYSIVAAPQTGSRADAVNGEVANTLKQYNEMLAKFTQTIGDMNRVVQEQNKGQLEMAKTMQKTLKVASKAVKHSVKDRKKAETAAGATGSILGVVKEFKDAFGSELTGELVRFAIGHGADFIGFGKGPSGAHPGSAQAIPKEPEKGESPGADDASKGGPAVSP